MRDALQDDDCVLIVLDDDGEEYTHQAGGFTCAHPVVRGRRVPLTGWLRQIDDDAYEALGNVWFYEHAPAEGRTLRADRVATVAAIVRRLEEANGCEIRLDAQSMQTAEWGEAWVPVLCEGESGFLVWQNSD